MKIEKLIKIEYNFLRINSKKLVKIIKAKNNTEYLIIY